MIARSVDCIHFTLNFVLAALSNRLAYVLTFDSLRCWIGNEVRWTMTEFQNNKKCLSLPGWGDSSIELIICAAVDLSSWFIMFILWKALLQLRPSKWSFLKNPAQLSHQQDNSQFCAAYRVNPKLVSQVIEQNQSNFGVNGKWAQSCKSKLFYWSQIINQTLCNVDPIVCRL